MVTAPSHPCSRRRLPALLTPPMDSSPRPTPSPAPAPFHFGDQRTRHSPHFIAEKTAEMICYLWFSTTLARPALPSPSMSRSRGRRQQHSSPLSPPDPARTALQFQPSKTFVQFLLKLLETTQVSQSVIVLALHYVYRLKEQNYMTFGQPGSELRVAVVALMMANKFVDDNTYTNKTWSEVSGIDLSEINKMEREFLGGVGYCLFVDKATYESWLHLLKGLVAAKESEHQQWLQSPSARRFTHPTAPRQKANRQRPSRLSVTSHAPRARSSSPCPSARSPRFDFTFVAQAGEQNPFVSQRPPTPKITAPTPTPPPAHAHAKRLAQEAFSPPSVAAHAALHPTKRPVSLDLAALQRDSAALSRLRELPDQDVEMDWTPPLPLQHPVPRRDALPPISTASLESFARLSLNSGRPSSPPPSARPAPSPYTTQNSSTAIVGHAPTQTLAAPYRMQRTAEPQALYFYTLAGSPLGDDADKPKARERKGRLRYHQPTKYPATASEAPLVESSKLPPPADHHSQLNLHVRSPSDYPVGARLPLSACTSPVTVRHPSLVTLPPMSQLTHLYTPDSAIGRRPFFQQPAPALLQLPQLQIPAHSHQAHSMLTPPPSSTSVSAPVSLVHAESAPFANAGPPGVRMPWASAGGHWPSPHVWQPRAPVPHSFWHTPPRPQRT